MTGIFAGKNLIVIQMETIDYWMITEEDLPAIYSLMNEGIHFTNVYTPGFAIGYTFKTKFGHERRKIEEMNAYVQEAHQINDAILIQTTISIIRD